MVGLKPANIGAQSWPLDVLAGLYIAFILQLLAKYLGCGVVHQQDQYLDDSNSLLQSLELA